jgi:hypothetical protein
MMARRSPCGADRPTVTTRLRSGQQPLDQSLRAFPSWFLRIVCDHCGKERMISETRVAHGEMPIRNILARMRHDGYGVVPARRSC